MAKVAHPTDILVGKRVSMCRKMRGLSQTNLGKVLGLSLAQIQKYERGTNRIGSSRLQRIAEILKVPVSYFFEGIPDQRDYAPVPETMSDFLGTAEGLALINAFSRIKSARLRRCLVDVIEGFANDYDEL